MIHRSYNQFHLGDNLIHLHFLRHLALRNPGHHFVHAVHCCYMEQLAPVIEDVPAVRLVDLEKIPRDEWGRNVWKNAGATVTRGGQVENYVAGYWEQHHLRDHYAPFYLVWFGVLAEEMGLQSPFREPADLLFDYPAITRRSAAVNRFLNRSAYNQFDFLVVNSQPSSGQLSAYNSTEYLTPLISDLAARYKVVCTQKPGCCNAECTTDDHLTLTDIGNLSLRCKYLIMVSTGPSWPTFNVWNRDSVRLRILLLDREQVDYAPNMIQVSTEDSVRKILRDRKLL